MSDITVKQYDDHQAFVITDKVRELTTCPICGSDRIEREIGAGSRVIGLQYTLVQLHTCEGCEREIVAVHSDLAEGVK